MQQTKQQSKQIVAKIILIGNSGVGKTSILGQKIRGVFKFDMQTSIYPESYLLNIKCDDVEIVMRLWDTAGQEKFRAITLSFYKETKGAFIVFDLTNRDSFENVRGWLRQLKNHAGEQIIRIILGNKSDLNPLAVTETELKELSSEVGAQYFMVSAAKNINIDQAFQEMAQQIKKKFSNNQLSNFGSQDIMQLNKESIINQPPDKSTCDC